MKHSLLLVLSVFLISSLVAQQRFPTGLIFDEAAYQALPVQELQLHYRLAPRHSLKRYAPQAQNQGGYNNCVGWSVAYAARTILYAQEMGWTQPAYINEYAFSPSFMYKLISRDNSCASAVSIEQALHVMTQQGAVFMRDIPNDCIRRLPNQSLAKAKLYRIDSYRRLFYKDASARTRVQNVKQAIAQGQPVIVGMKCTPSFEYADGKDIWIPMESPRSRNAYGHAVTIVSYDDEKYGGAFEIMNSWGSKWGDEGFIWVRYKDFAAFSKYAYVPIGRH